MVRTYIDRDETPLRDCIGKWFRAENQPYYQIEKNFNEQKGNILIFNLLFG